MESLKTNMSLPHLIDLLRDSNDKISYLQSQLQQVTDETLKLTILIHRLKGHLLCPRCRLLWDNPRLDEKAVCQSCDLILKTFE